MRRARGGSAARDSPDGPLARRPGRSNERASHGGNSGRTSPSTTRAAPMRAYFGAFVIRSTYRAIMLNLAEKACHA
ncbi:hypothetical protein BURPS305_3834 [Burkholderia pseudomallei 305]|nr:hypothetical protein BURPS305_3834 [Burkholderia pseudomallei 305]